MNNLPSRLYFVYVLICISFMKYVELATCHDASYLLIEL